MEGKEGRRLLLTWEFNDDFRVVEPSLHISNGVCECVRCGCWSGDEAEDLGRKNKEILHCFSLGVIEIYECEK